MPAERTFAAMGTTVRIGVEVADEACGDLLDLGQRTVVDLEGRWSRFDPRSELSELNASAGFPVVVSELTFDLVAAAVAAWSASRGAFDPTVLDALEQAGYDRPFAAGLDRAGRSIAVQVLGPALIDLDRSSRLIRLPVGCRLDLGGIAKGATADLVSALLVEAGAAATSVSVGGDIRVRSIPGAAPWPVALGLLPDAAPLLLLDGAVCTSSRRRRSWRVGETSRAHHLIDPRTGSSFTGPVVEVSVAAGNALTAEILTKAVFAFDRSEAADVLDAHGAGAVVLDDTGELHTVGTWPDAVPVPSPQEAVT